MPMQRQQLDVSPATGLDQKADVRDLEASGAVVMQNCVRQKNNSVRKRFGHVSRNKSTTAGGVISSAVAGGSYKGAPWLADNSAMLNAYSDAAGEWSGLDLLPEGVALDRLGLVSFTQAIIEIDQVYIDGLLLVVFTADPYGLGLTSLFWTLVDPLARTAVVASQILDINLLTGINSPRLCAVGPLAILTYVRAGNIQARLFTPNVTWGAENTIATDGVVNVVNGVYDLGPIAGDTTRFALAYQVSSGGKNVAIKTFSSSTFALLSTQLEDTTATSVYDISVSAASGGQFWASYSGAVGATKTLRAFAFLDGAGSPTFAATTFYTFTPDLPGRVVSALVDSTHLMIFWSPFVDITQTDGVCMAASYVKSINVSTAGAIVGLTRATFCVVLRSKPIVAVNGAGATVAYLAVNNVSQNQGTTFLVCCDYFANTGALSPSPLRNVATLDPRLSKNTSAMIPVGSTCHSATNLVNPTNVGTSVIGLLTFENTSPTHVSAYEHFIDLASQRRYSSAELYELEAISSGVPSVFDGQWVSEIGFAWYPHVSAGSYATTGGGLQTSGTYQYCCCYEAYDNRGQVHRSAPSEPFLLTASGSGNTGLATMTAVTLSLTQRRQMTSSLPRKSQAYLVWYRTQANGTIFYRVTADPPAAADQETLNASTTTITDGATDALIAVNPVLYTTGGNLPGFCPPSARIAVLHTNRWFLAGCPEPTALWASKALTTGECPAFNEALNNTCSGAIRALRSLDDKLVIFVQRGPTYGIEFMTGGGPFDNGAQSDWTPPQPVPSDVGAVDQRGTCVGPFGVLFRATVGGPNGSGGVFLLSRDLQVHYLSGPVEDLLQANPVVTSMIVHPTAGRVYITCVPSETGFTSGVRLVWDYLQGGAWSSDVIADADTSQAAAGARCAFVATTTTYGAAYHWVTASGRVYVETNGVGANAYTDAATWITMSYTSAWLKPSKAGFARFWRVAMSADSLDPAIFTWGLNFDYAPSSVYTESVPSGAYAAVTAFDRFPQVDVDKTPNNQKAKAIQVYFSDAPPTPSGFTTGQGLSLNGFQLDIGVKEGPYQNLPQGQRN